MGLHFEQRSNGGVLVEAAGVITSEDLVRANDMIYGSEEKIKALKYQIWDFEKAEDLIARAEDLRRLAAQDAVAAAINSNILIAVISPRDYGFGMGRMWESFVAETAIHSHVFRTREEAESWIDSKIASLC